MTAPLIIVGGGLAGGLAALALAERRRDVPFLLLDAGDRFGGQHTWSWFDSDIAPAAEWLAARLDATRWRGHEVRFPARSRGLGGGYNSLSSERFDRLLRRSLPPGAWRLGAAVADVAPQAVTLADGETLAASAVIDARGAAPGSDGAIAWQKFLGLTCRFDRPHGLERPIVMDALVDQSFGYRFVYCLPFSETEILIEDTYYATEPAIDAARLRRHIGDYARAAGWGEFEPVAEEVGVLPILLGGRFDQWWPEEEAIARLGLRGGFFHPTTGYSLPDALANAALLADQPDLSPRALERLFRRRAERLWGERGFYRMLNRMLFNAAAPRHRYRVLEHFYRLPEPVIARFYAARSRPLDKLRILSGRPPVPLRAALSAMRERR